jgi:hypothetical protein
MFRKLLSISLAMVLLVSMTGMVDIATLSPYSYVTDEQIFCTATLEDDFQDNSVVVILTKSASRDNRDWTTRDFRDVGAVEIEDIVRLCNQENVSAQEVWQAERSSRILRNNMAYQTYETVREQAEEDTIVNFDEFRRIFVIKLDKNCKSNVLRVISQLQKRDYIRYVGPNYIEKYNVLESVKTPNDHYYNNVATNHRSYQWAINKINLPAAWNITTGSPEILVGVIDSGIQRTHPDLINRVNVSLSRDFVGQAGGGFADDSGHGTQVAGIIGAQGNNSIGIAGVAWNIRLVSLRVLMHEDSEWGSNGINAVASAVNHARKNRIQILNASLSIGYNNSENQVVRDAVAGYRGVFVVSAGNYGSNTNNSPRFQGFSNVIVVGATNSDDTRRSNSNFGTNSVHLFAPGNDIISTFPTNICDIQTRCGSQNCDVRGYHFFSMTSSAAPHVAGVAALILSQYPNLSPAQVKNAILNGADTLPNLHGQGVSGKRLNAHKALQMAQNLDSSGIYHIRNKALNRYLNSPSTNNANVTLANSYSDVVAQRWVVQMTNNNYQIRSSFHINSSIARIVNFNNGTARVETGTSGTNVSIVHNADGTVTFRWGSTTNVLTANSNGTVTWAANNGSDNQRWFLEPHRLSYAHGDVNQDGRICGIDMARVLQFVQNPAPITAVEFYLADMNRDGVISVLDWLLVQEIVTA